MKILVTGGAGFIASQIVDRYISLGHKVVVIDNLSTGKEEYINKKAVFYNADICDKNEIKKIINNEKPEVINHHAAQISVRLSVENPVFDATVNIMGLLHLLEEGRKQNLQKFIFASSGGVVYGEAQKIPTPEEYYPQVPLSPYGITKLASEHYLNVYYRTYKIPFVALRYANVYGQRQNPHGEAGVVAIFMKKLIHGETPIINGDGLQTRDYVFVGDIVEANQSALTTSFVGSCNIGTGQECDVNTLYAKTQQVLGVTREPIHGPAKPGEQSRSCLTNKKALKVLGWKPGTSFEAGLKKTSLFFLNARS